MMVDTGARITIGLNPELNVRVALFIFEDARLEIGTLHAGLWDRYPDVREAFIQTARAAAHASVADCLKDGETVHLVEERGDPDPKP